MNEFEMIIKNELLVKPIVFLKIKVLPKSPINEIVDRLEDGTYEIRIKAAATDGKANEGLIKFLKKSLQVEEVIILSGQTNRTKLVKIIK